MILWHRRQMILAAPSAARLGLALGLAGCRSPAPPPPPTLDLRVSGSAGQNADAAGRPSPVAVRLYELAAASRFEQADALALIGREAEILGADLLGSDSFILAPAQSRTVARELKPSTRFLGVAVLFRDIDQAGWRALSPVAAHGPTRLALSVGTLAVSLQQAAGP